MSWKVGEHTHCIVTGGSAGIGRETARGLAQRGASVTIIGRNPERTARVAAEIGESTGNDRVGYELCDFSSLEQVRRLGDVLLQSHPSIHLLVNNAGVWHPRPRLSHDGHDDTFAVNHLAHFALTNALLDRLKASSPARIVHVSSRLHSLVRTMGFEQLPGSPRFDVFGFIAYSRSKLANLLFSNELARRLEGTGVTSNALHPGDVATDVVRDVWLTRIGVHIARLWLLTPEQGARTSLHVASAPELADTTGCYFADCAEREPSATAIEVDAAQRLWAMSAELTDSPAVR